MEKLNGTFSARDTKGNVVRLREFQEMIDVTTLQDSAKKYMPGLKRITTESGAAVNVLGEHEFEVVSTGERLTVTP